MEKMSAEQYAEMVQKLAEEIVDEITEPEVYTEGMEVMAGEGFTEEEIAERALAAYESAQMRKEASENDYAVACAYEEAAMMVMDELEDEE